MAVRAHCLAAFEIKVSASISRQDFRHADWFAARGPGRKRQVTKAAKRARRLPERPADSPECATMPPKRLFHGLRRIRPANPSAQTIGRNRSCLMPTQPKNYPPDWA